MSMKKNHDGKTFSTYRGAYDYCVQITKTSPSPILVAYFDRINNVVRCVETFGFKFDVKAIQQLSLF